MKKGYKIPAVDEDQSSEFEWQTFEDLQKLVGGYVERVHFGKPIERKVWPGSIMVVDEEGIRKGYKVNLRASWLYGSAIHGQMIYGDALIVGEGTDETGDIGFIDLDQNIIEEVKQELELRVFL